MVVSSETPRMRLAETGPFLRVAFMGCAQALPDDRPSPCCPGLFFSRPGSFSTFTPWWIRRVASPPSSTIRSGPVPSGQVRACSVHHQYSSSDSPFQAKTAAVPALAMAAAAWSWVEKMLQEAQRTSAPSSTSVSMSMAVWMVMCRLPVTFRPLQGFLRAVRLADGHQSGHLVPGRGAFPCGPSRPARDRQSYRGVCGRLSVVFM